MIPRWTTASALVAPRLRPSTSSSEPRRTSARARAATGRSRRTSCRALARQHQPRLRAERLQLPRHRLRERVHRRRGGRAHRQQVRRPQRRGRLGVRDHAGPPLPRLLQHGLSHRDRAPRVRLEPLARRGHRRALQALRHPMPAFLTGTSTGSTRSPLDAGGTTARGVVITFHSGRGSLQPGPDERPVIRTAGSPCIVSSVRASVPWPAPRLPAPPPKPSNAPHPSERRSAGQPWARRR